MTTVEIVDEPRTRELRRSVLRPHLLPGDPMPGDELTNPVFLGAVEADGTVACTCFVYPDPCPWLRDRAAWRLRSMATLPERRGEGLGRVVVQAALDHAAEQGAEILWCNARETAVGFYAALGFVAHGGVFTDERHTIPHVRMWRELSGRTTSSE